MKCNNCGAPLQLNQKFCPNCGSPNEQALKHVNDMENYDKKFNRTRSKVISNSKWFVKNITPIAVVMLSAIVLAAALIANNSMLGYRLAENSNKKYNKEHNDEIQIQLRELLDNEDYGTLYELYETADRIIITDDYKYGWSSFYSILYDYLEIRRAICGIKEAEGDSSSYSWDDSLNRAARSRYFFIPALVGFTSNKTMIFAIFIFSLCSDVFWFTSFTWPVAIYLFCPFHAQ